MRSFIKRLQVEEGFLGGLDVPFTSGLNVIIGPRGVGKTSVIELIRYCLGVRGLTEKSEERSREHALSILGTGEVTVTLRDGENQILISRSASDDEPRSSFPFRPPLVLSQSEIERVGLEARGRLRIIDGFTDVKPEHSAEEQALEALIRSLTLQIRELTLEGEATTEQMVLLATVEEELSSAMATQTEVLKSLGKSEKLQARLKELASALAVVGVRATQLDNAVLEVSNWQKAVRAVGTPPRVPEWPDAAGANDLLAPIRASVRQIGLVFGEGVAQLDAVVRQINEVRKANQAETLGLEDKARHLRSELEQLKTGAGAAAHRVAVLQEKAAQLAAFRTRAGELARRIDETRAQRASALAELQGLRDERFKFRSRVAKTLSEELGPSIQVSVEQGGNAPSYISAIQGAIRGSGLHHNTLAPQLAAALSPRELSEAVEMGDGQTIASLTGIGEDRAAKVVAAIARAGTEEIITAQIHDGVTMRLLDGAEYRPTSELSTGQRCTVVLSVLLGYRGRGLVIDQPEDHIDNAFIVRTLIEAVRRRKTETQMIFTTHNANIPVLGDANMVLLLGSDGQRGFVRHGGPLNDPKIVEAITSVMEGGWEAFERRAEFYHKWL